MRTLSLILIISLIFLIGCAVPEPVPEKKIKILEVESVPEPEPVMPEPEPVVEPEPVTQTVPVGGEVQCENPERFTYVGGYCVEDACQNKAVKCMKQGIKIMRPPCECWIYFGEATCSIKAAEETRSKSPLCTRRGQSGSICGAYDSNKGHCVNF